MAKRKACSTGKKKYPNIWLAYQALDRADTGKWRDINKKPKRAYFCHRCKTYHLTSKGAF